MSISKKHAPKMILSNEKKKWKDSDNFWHRKLTLKVINWHFSIAWFRTYVDLSKSAIYHSIKLPFDVEVAEKSLNDIYYVDTTWDFLGWYIVVVLCI